MKNISKAIDISEYLRNNHKNINNTNKVHYGIGINDADYSTDTSENKQRISCPCYKAWVRMLERAYSSKWHTKYPSYSNVLVCKDWLYFSNFRKWWINNYIDGYQLDKDILSKEIKIYSPETCIYIPQWLNKFTIDCSRTRGDYKIGVTYHNISGKFQARCRNPITKKRECLGLFESEGGAHNAWLKRKIELALELKPEMDIIDLRIYPNVVEIIKNIK